jgi:alpha-glucosidase
VPLPWTATGPSLGFGPAAAHLPQPEWFAARAADVQEGDPTSTLSFYREALAWRRRLRTGEELVFEDAPEGVVRFRRPGGWTCVTNFTPRAVPLPPGRVVLSSGAPVDGAGGELPAETTVWLLAD